MRGRACAPTPTGRSDECLAAIAEHLAHAPTRLEAAVPRPENSALSDAALGTRHSYGDTLVGLAAHLAYHAGQLVLLRRALDAAAAPG
jgi:hypothetical protein